MQKAISVYVFFGFLVLIVINYLKIFFEKRAVLTNQLGIDLLLITLVSWETMIKPFKIPCAFTVLQSIYAIAVSSRYQVPAAHLHEFGQGNRESIEVYVKSYCCLFIIIYAIGNIVQYYIQDRTRRNTYLKQFQLTNEEHQVDQMLANLLPAFVRAKISKSGLTQIEEDQNNVAVMFIEICNFDEILQSQKKVINFLDNAFRVFDQVCSKFQVFKIETVGKVYLASSGLNFAQSISQNQNKIIQDNESRIIVECALQIQSQIKQLKWGSGNKTRPLELKIGINFGRVIVGVIGYHKP